MPENGEVCGRIPFDGAACAFTLSGPDRDMDESDWLRWINSPEGRVCMSAEYWGKLKKQMLEECIDNPRSCRSVKREHGIRSFTEKFEDFEKRSIAK